MVSPLIPLYTYEKIIPLYICGTIYFTTSVFELSIFADVPFFYRMYLNYYGLFVIYILCANFTVSHFSYLVEKSPRKRLEKKTSKNISGTFSFKLNVKENIPLP